MTFCLYYAVNDFRKEDHEKLYEQSVGRLDEFELYPERNRNCLINIVCNMTVISAIYRIFD